MMAWSISSSRLSDCKIGSVGDAICQKAMGRQSNIELVDCVKLGTMHKGSMLANIEKGEEAGSWKMDAT